MKLERGDIKNRGVSIKLLAGIGPSPYSSSGRGGGGGGINHF